MDGHFLVGDGPFGQALVNAKAECEGLWAFDSIVGGNQVADLSSYGNTGFPRRRLAR